MKGQQASLALRGLAAAPLADRLARDALRSGYRRNRPTAGQTLLHQHSTMAGCARIIMVVHPRSGLKCIVDWANFDCIRWLSLSSTRRFASVRASGAT
jgi:hypothetical protein